jgi:hypothetical protein
MNKKSYADLEMELLQTQMQLAQTNSALGQANAMLGQLMQERVGAQIQAKQAELKAAQLTQERAPLVAVANSDIPEAAPSAGLTE